MPQQVHDPANSQPSIDVGPTEDLSLRVSVATLDRVVFQRPADGTLMLALERKATHIDDTDRRSVYVRAQPFGGAVRILKPDALREVVDDFNFDSKRSEAEQDFRLLIQPVAWEAVKQFCIHHLQDPNDPVLESDPRRELGEEFAECLQVNLRPDQYIYHPVGFVLENEPTTTDNVYSRGLPTVRIYRIFEVRLVDESLSRKFVTTSERYSDSDLQTLALADAQNTGRGRANSVLVLPIDLLVDLYLKIPPEKRYSPGLGGGHQLDTSVLAILENVDVPQFQWR
jgi:hypothetical protein